MELNRRIVARDLPLFVTCGAYEYFDQLNIQKEMPLWMIICLNNDPMFDSLREEPQFKQIVRDVEAKYQAEHERVRRWMEENELI